MEIHTPSFISRLFQRYQTREISKRKYVFTIVAAILTTCILAYLIYSQREILLNYEWNIRPVYFFSAFLVYSVILLLNVLAWTAMMNRFGSKVDIGTHFRSTTISALGKRLPGTMWYVWWRAEIYKENFSAKAIAFASTIEMAVTIIAAVIICVIFAIRMVSQYKYSLVGIVILFVISLIALHPRFIRWVLKKIGNEDFNIRFRDLFLWIVLYMLIWILVGVLLFNISNIVTNVSADQIGYFIGSVAITGILSRLLLFSPSVFGFTEVSLSLLLSAIMPSSIAVVVALANRIIVISFEVIWALISISVGRISFRQAK